MSRTTFVDDLYLARRDAIATGDVIDFSGGGAASSVIKRHTGSPFSHVGIALWVVVGGTRRLVIVESTTLSETADVDGTFRAGVQMCLLSQRVSGYDGRIWHQPLAQPLEDWARDGMVAWLTQQHAMRVAYDTVGAVRAGLDWWERQPRWLRVLTWPLYWTRVGKPDYGRLFCSELVGSALQLAGRLDPAANPSEMTPADIVALGCLSPVLTPLRYPAAPWVRPSPASPSRTPGPPRSAA